MTEATEVEELLALLQREGEMHSRGRFTLDPGRNREKIGLFLNQDPAAWFYWFLRCGVCLGCIRCELQVGRNAMLATLWFAAEAPAVTRLTAFLEGGDDDGDGPGLSLLRSCLLWTQSWLAMQAGFRASLLWQRPGLPLCSLQMTSSQASRQQDRRIGTECQLVLAFLPPDKVDGLGVFVAQRDHLRAVLPARVAFCPVPVSLDGRRVDSGRLLEDDGMPLYLRYYLDAGRRNRLAVSPPDLLPAHHYRLETPVAEIFSRPRFCLPGAQVHTLSLAGGLDPQARWSDSQGYRLTEWSTGSQEFCLHVTGLMPNQTPTHWLVRALLQRGVPAPDRWAVVHYGLLLDWEALALTSQPSLNGWHAVVAVDKIGTDLSGLRITQDVLYGQLSGWLTEEMVDIHLQQAAAA